MKRFALLFFLLMTSVSLRAAVAAAPSVMISKAGFFDAAASAVQGGYAVVFQGDGSYPNIFWHAPSTDGWDWSSRKAVVFTLTNPATTDQDFMVRLDDTTPDGKDNVTQIGATIAAGKTQTYNLSLSLTGVPDDSPDAGVALNSHATVDTQHITSFQIFLSTPSKPTTLIVRSVYVDGGAGPMAVGTPVPPKLPFLSPMFGDNMVLQRGVSDRIWGWTTPGTPVTLTLKGKTYMAHADSTGKWIVSTDAQPAGGPYTITINGPTTQTLNNVLFGDVWFCSGQSNMEMGVGLANNGAQEVASANYPTIRLMRCPHSAANLPQLSLSATNPTELTWQVCSPATVGQGGWGGFSAAAYFFGRHLTKSLNVPIGLIQDAWGGQPIQPFISDGSMRTMADYAKIVDRLTSVPDVDSLTYAVNSDLAAWLTANDPGTAGSANWAAPDFDDSNWQVMHIDTWWVPSWTASLTKFKGIVWYRSTFTAPDAWSGHQLQLSLAQIDDAVTVYVNGNAVNTTYRANNPTLATVPASLVKVGQNTIALRILVTNGGPGFYSHTSNYGKQADLWVSTTDDPTTKVALSADWKFQTAADLKSLPPLPTLLDLSQMQPAFIYNAMIAPVTPLAIKGVLWYQGEANENAPFEYRPLMPLIIADWRKQFNVPNLPFILVQLASNGKGDTSGWNNYVAELREAQLMAFETVPNTGMAVAIDAGAANNIHPTDKQDVGDRLALNALALAYGQKIEYSGPIYQAMKVEGTAIRLSFTHADGLNAKGGTLIGFTIAGADNNYVPATATIDGSTVVVSSPSVAAPVAVRYGWASYSDCNLYNSANLPASPFRTDTTTDLTQSAGN